jgi:hypothetical protein
VRLRHRRAAVIPSRVHIGSESFDVQRVVLGKLRQLLVSDGDVRVELVRIQQLDARGDADELRLLEWNLLAELHRLRLLHV